MYTTFRSVSAVLFFVASTHANPNFLDIEARYFIGQFNDAEFPFALDTCNPLGPEFVTLSQRATCIDENTVEYSLYSDTACQNILPDFPIAFTGDPEADTGNNVTFVTQTGAGTIFDFNCDPSRIDAYAEVELQVGSCSSSQDFKLFAALDTCTANTGVFGANLEADAYENLYVYCNDTEAELQLYDTPNETVATCDIEDLDLVAILRPTCGYFLTTYDGDALYGTLLQCVIGSDTPDFNISLNDTLEFETTELDLNITDLTNITDFNFTDSITGNAIPISYGETIVDSTVGEPTVFPDGITSCGTSITTGGVLFVIEGEQGFMTATTCSSTTNYDTKLSIFSGPDINSLTCEAGIDDSSCSFNGLFSTVEISTSAGTLYFILVHGWSSSRGTFALTVTHAEVIPIPISYGQTIVDSTVGEPVITLGGSSFCGTSISTSGVLFVIEGDGGRLTASTCSGTTNYDTKLSIYTGDDVSTASCLEGQDDSVCPFNNLHTFEDVQTIEGELYYILVHGYASRTGTFALTVTTSLATDPPFIFNATFDFFNDTFDFNETIDFNDTSDVDSSTTEAGPQLETTEFDFDFNDTIDLNGTFDFNDSFIIIPIPISYGQTIVDSTIGEPTLRPDGSSFCGTSITTSGVLFVIEGDGGILTASTCSGTTNYDTKLSIFTGTDVYNLVCLEGQDDSSCPFNGLHTFEEVQTTAGSLYFILVHGYANSRGTFALTVTTSLDDEPPFIFNATFIDFNDTFEFSTTEVSEPETTVEEGLNCQAIFGDACLECDMNGCAECASGYRRISAGSSGTYVCVEHNDAACSDGINRCVFQNCGDGFENPYCGRFTSWGCTECQEGFFKKSHNFPCVSCGTINGCMECNDFEGCSSCQYGMVRYYDPVCGIFRCSDTCAYPQ